MSSVEAWPDWALRLPPSSDGRRRAEGGRRLGPLGAKSSRPGEPLVSYVTVVRNAESTLERALRSVREQRWKNVEHVVLDGMSTDGTLAIIEAHAEQIDYFASEPDGGFYDALNKAVALARGDLICVLNADDWLTSDAAQLAVEAHLAAGPGARPRLVLSAAWSHGPDGRTLWPAHALDFGCYLSCANVCHNAVYATPQAYRASGPYATHLPIAADFRWLMACVEAGVEVIAIDKPTVHYQRGGLSGDLHQHTLDCLQVLRERFPSLQESEAWGLLHAFHFHSKSLRAFAASRPPQLERFLDEVARTHGGEADFLHALSLASARRLGHPADERGRWLRKRVRRTRRAIREHWMVLRSVLRR
jgi:hypothetical protein